MADEDSKNPKDHPIPGVVHPKGLSTKPKNIRKRIRRKTGPLSTELELLYAGRKPIEEWDFEELSRGRPKGDDGKFHGPTPKWITPAIRDEAQRRLQIKGRELLHAEVGGAIKILSEIMRDDSVDLDGKPAVPVSDRRQAAVFIVEHALGKATAKVEVDVGDKLRQMLAGAIVMPDGQPMLPSSDMDEDDTVDGELVDSDS